jgi:predicted MFS family arabinose efflux permease
MTDNYGPSSIFWFVALFAAVALVGINLVLPRPVRPDPSQQAIDWLGGILFPPAIALLLLAISGGRQAGWLADLAWPMAIAGLLLLAFWFRYESRHPAPLINVRLLSNRYCAVGLVVTALVATGAFQIAETVSLLLQQPIWTGVGLGMTAMVVGLLKLPTTGAGALSSLATGWLAGRWGPIPCTLAGASIVAASSFAVQPFLDSLAVVAAALLTISIGLTAALTSAPVLLALGTPHDRTSEVMGVMAVVRAVFQGVGAQVVAVILASWVVIGPNDVHYPAATAYRMAFVYIGVTAILMVLAVTPLLRRGRLRQVQ